MSAVTAGLVLAGATGCAPNKPDLRLNAPPQGDSDEQPRLAQYFAYHNDQGMLADMSIADIHFVPHSPDLSGTGEARLARYAELLAETGGIIRYDTAIRDEGLIRVRLATARSFLTDALPSTGTLEVKTGLAGGRGMTAKEASSGKEVAKQAEPRKLSYYLKYSTGGV